jgi:carboxypeptidase C (cathepsin A)
MADMMIDLRRSGVAVLIAFATTAALAQEHPGRPAGHPEHRESGQQEQNAPGVLSLLPSDAITEHRVDTAGSRLTYTATAGTFSLFDQAGERSAAVFYTAYVAKSKDSQRPLTFVFNGGPGAASAFLNLGLVGPRVAEFGMGGHDGANVRLTDNPDTWLAFTDLVLIDPVATGWSRTAKPDGGTAFWGVRRDSESMAKVIALYVAKNGRASSPKYILGESYGGFRAVKVASDLQRDQGIVVTGIIMVSPMVESGLHFGSDRLALGAALQLPSLVATELERTGTFSKEALAEAEHFALTEYLTMLAGPPVSGDAAKAFYARLAQMTGLPEDVIARTRGFIRDGYVKNLPSREHKIVSHYDATFATDDPFPESPEVRGPDAMLDGLVRAYGGIFVGYARDELGFKTELTYKLLDSEISGKWDWHDGSGPAPPSANDELRELLAVILSFRLLIAHGYSDMVTPYAVSRYILDHLPPPIEEQRAELRLYRGGHMFYIDPQSRKAFTADARMIYVQP